MKQLVALIKPTILLSTLIIVTVYVILALTAPFIRNKSSYVAASLDKENRLEVAMSPRIVLVGGSNLALGVDCQALSKHTHVNVVNMGLHAGLGLNFILNEALSGVKYGDTVILSIEYFLEDGNKKLMAQLADVNPSAISKMKLSLSDRLRILVSQLQLCLSSTFYKIINKQDDPIYYREGFNKYGDLKTHFNQKKPTAPSGSVVFTNTDYVNGIKEINKFIESVKIKGAKVYFTYPAFQRSTYNLNKEKLNSLANQYDKELVCPILGSMETFVFDDKYFFDTVYHLDSIGIQKRTEIMLQLIRKANINNVP
ncbi:hypothetical protein [Spirosoma fluviale]|uniref:SGNH/GDSL hydrolase family protein n=1 Tax=Spirosoma fluviale TaxID=1597977 RepID=A0A286GHT8_9BACT|nr:hypothetical protein [Spirosoma fluviale]SOD95097.1 hypothetical protein SAMN06269250_4742 [Spirosoma fluviale]